MNDTHLQITHRIAEMASSLQEQRTGRAPKAVTVVLSEDTLVVTLHDALTPAEKAMSRTPEGAAQVQDFHRQLFASCTDEMCGARSSESLAATCAKQPRKLKPRRAQ